MFVYIDTLDPRLSPTEKQVLTNLASRLQAPARAPLSAGELEAIAEAFGEITIVRGCGKGQK
jgi:hypothetical protein